MVKRATKTKIDKTEAIETTTKTKRGPRKTTNTKDKSLKKDIAKPAKPPKSTPSKKEASSKKQKTEVKNAASERLPLQTELEKSRTNSCLGTNVH